ncbi:MAG: zincin-like metallopeptidase domain-containing protein, partial [Sphingobacteriia bacterium]
MTHPLLTRFEQLNGRHVTLPELKNFLARVQGELDNHSHGPAASALENVRKRLANAIQKATPYFANAQPGDQFKVVLSGRKPKATQKPAAGDDVSDLLYGLPTSGEPEKGLGFTQEGQFKIYDMVTNMVQETMKKDGLFWRKKWDAGGAYHARSFPALRYYNGANWILLTMMANLNFGYSSPYFLTFKAIKEAGGKLREKAEGWPVVYYNRVYKLNGKSISEQQFNNLPKDEQKKVVQIPFIQYYRVFNGEDVTGIDLPKTKHQEAILSKPEPEAIASCEHIVANMPNRPDIDHGHRTAHYLPGSDKIDMPDKRAFTDMQSYYSTLFHELVHSTGHKTRLNRDLTGAHDDSKEYFFEELVAELGASYLCAHAGILYHTLKDSANYVKHYTEELQKIMKDDKKFFLKAAAAAQKAADYITNNKFSAQQPEKVKQKKISEAKRDFDDIKSKLKDPDQFQREFDESGLNHYQFLQVVAFTGSWAQAQKTSVEKLIRIPGIGKALANKIRGKARQRKAVFAKLEKTKKAWPKKSGVRVDPAVDNFYPTEDEAKKHASQNQTVRQAKDGMWEVINKPVAKPSPIKNLNGIVDAAHLAGINFSVIDLPEPYRTQLHKLHSDSQVMMWGIPGSGKTVYTLKFGQALAELGLPVLYVANEEYGRSTFSEKIRTFNIGHPNLKFAKTLDESVIDQFAVVFLDSINSLGMTLRDWIKFRDRHPGKLFVLIVQSTKDGDFRGGKDWEHEVDIAGEIINRQLVLRKNRLDPDNASKYEQRMTQAAID